MRLLDQRFKYIPSTSTNIVETWKRHGYKPTTEAERRARQNKTEGTVKYPPLTPIDLAQHRKAKQ